MDAGASSVGGAISKFSDRMLRFLDRVEHRRADTRSEKEAVYRLRYEAYVRQGLIAPRTEGHLYDSAFDDASNSWITTTFIDGQLASTFRVHVATDENSPLPSLVPFSDAIMPRLRMGRVIVDPTRLAARLEFSRRFPELPYFALRPAWLAAEHFGADFVVATIVDKHQAFYRHAFGYESWCEPRDYPAFNLKVACMGLDFRAAKERVENRYPFFRSTQVERDALFGRSASRPPSHLPTAPQDWLRAMAG
jgi:hypothetical protein